MDNITVNDKQFVWVEKYRPIKIDECILTETMKETFKEFVEQKQIPHLLFSGSPGIGKTTVAKALCEEIGAEYIVINGSNERNIDMLRTTVQKFASTVSVFNGNGKKVVILDEADYLNSVSTQPALRNFMETFSQNCRFIFTCNYLNKIIPALQSRCSVIHFNILSTDVNAISFALFQRVKQILTLEKVEFEEKTIVSIIKKYFPDIRKILNVLQTNSVAGKLSSKLDVGITDVKPLLKALKEKNFKEMRGWVAQNIDMDTERIFRGIYDEVIKVGLFESSSIPSAINIIHEHLYQSNFVADKEINLVSCLCNLLSDCDLIGA